MTHQVQHTAAGEGIELTAPDAVLTVKIAGDHTDDHYELFEVDAPRGPATPLHRTGWATAYYVLHGRMIVQVEDAAFDLAPGSSITIPPAALHTFTVLSPTTKFLAVCMTGAMGRFHADLATSVPHAPSRRDNGCRIILVDQQRALDRTVAGVDQVHLPGLCQRCCGLSGSSIRAFAHFVIFALVSTLGIRARREDLGDHLCTSGSRSWTSCSAGPGVASLTP
jgi:quercetin dioxygenase-like cupin family protein